MGIGFATGRKNFRKVLNSYIYSWNESGIKDTTQERISLNLFVAYDLEYSDAQSTDFTNLNQEVVDTFDEIVFLGAKNAQKGVQQLIANGDLTETDAKLIFAAGYAGKRNAILYAALENQMDYLLFLDDDEYPVAVTNNHGTCLWSGQYVLPMHLQNIKDADVTNGYHCGYISPIPQIRFNELLSESDFRQFIEAISNDVLNWDSVQRIMNSGGVTYGDVSVLISNETVCVQEVRRCKFITGSNLCLNLTKPERTAPFYNPPGARGEDTFLSTLLVNRTVLRVPCYTFHDGFSAYRHLLDGVLPIELASITAKSRKIVIRFYNACLGWVRYKPLLTYLTNPEGYEDTMKNTQAVLSKILPKLSEYFDYPDFLKIGAELDKYRKNVKRHSDQFQKVQSAWIQLVKKL